MWWIVGGERGSVCVWVYVCIQGLGSFEKVVSCLWQRETETQKDTGTPTTE